MWCYTTIGISLAMPLMACGNGSELWKLSAIKTIVLMLQKYTQLWFSN